MTPQNINGGTTGVFFRNQLKFFADKISADRTDIVIALDGKEVVRKQSERSDFQATSAKSVISMAMTKVFDGQNCACRSLNAKVTNLRTQKYGSTEYTDFYSNVLYSKWNPSAGKGGMQYGSTVCIPPYVHWSEEGGVSIYKQQ